MLSKKDLANIRTIFQEELKDALVRKIAIQRGMPKEGEPAYVIKEEDWNVLDFLAVYLPKIEGSLRGVQEQADFTKNLVDQQSILLGDFNYKIDAVGNALLGIEGSAKKLAIASDKTEVLEMIDES